MLPPSLQAPPRLRSRTSVRALARRSGSGNSVVPPLACPELTHLVATHAGVGGTTSADYNEWAITFDSLVDDLPLLRVRSNDGPSEIEIREVLSPRHYRLDAILHDPLRYTTSRGFKLD